MKTSRIDLVGQNGNDGLHYKYEEVADSILTTIFGEEWKKYAVIPYDEYHAIIKILVENFPNE